VNEKTKCERKLFPSAEEDIKRANDPYASELLTKSPSYRLAYDDQEFILSDEMRPVRLMLEHSKTELTLNQHNIHDTVVVFGSGRTLTPEVARLQLLETQKLVDKQPNDVALQTKLKVAQKKLDQSRYYEHARELASLVTEQSMLPNTPNLHIVTGGGPGIMQAANQGASDVGGKSVGLNIVLPEQQQPNPYITPDLCFRFHYFAMRKMHFLLRAQALVVFPGGFGTMDELFEALTLIQTQKIQSLPILLFGKDFWQRAMPFHILLEEGMIREDDLRLFHYVESAKEAWDIIARHVREGAKINS
jgi:uncharacterized protein (TIGR00730 family)